MQPPSLVMRTQVVKPSASEITPASSSTGAIARMVLPCGTSTTTREGSAGSFGAP
jgi:hypothetical protein